MEDSDGNKAKPGNAGMPQVEFGSSDKPSSGFADSSDPFEDDLDNALCVFKSGDANSDMLEKNDGLILFYVDLENE